MNGSHTNERDPITRARVILGPGSETMDARALEPWIKEQARLFADYTLAYEEAGDPGAQNYRKIAQERHALAQALRDIA